MMSPEERTRNVGEVIRRRKRLVSLSSMPFFVLAAVAILSRLTAGRFLGIRFAVAGPVAFATFLATFVIHVIILRCPACEGYLGLVGWSNFCPKCGTRFTGGAPEEARTGERR